MVDAQPLLKKIKLNRFPTAHDQSLKAWDWADELLIHQILSFESPFQSILIVGDEFGSLTTYLANQYNVYWLNDSLTSEIAANKNLTANGINKDRVTWLNSSRPLPTKRFDLIVIRPPKNLNYFADTLNQLSNQYAHTPIFIGVMQKFITEGLKASINNSCDEVNPGRGEKKARVIKAQLKANQHLNEPYYLFNHEGLTLANRSNVFSSRSIDIGARFFLEYFPELTNKQLMIDCGCGNGVLSAFAAKHFPKLNIVGLDESYMAIDSAQKTIELNQLNHREGSTEFLLSNCFSAAFQNHLKPDVIICNPPFHQERRVTTDTAQLMIEQSYDILTQNGDFWVVANRHLNYQHTIKKVFGHCNWIESNHKFIILHSSKN